jgi:hypothetical protein
MVTRIEIGIWNYLGKKSRVEMCQEVEDGAIEKAVAGSSVIYYAVKLYNTPWKLPL